MALAPGDRLGSYEIIEHLGSGGMGEVYRARDVALGRSIALKVLPSDTSAPLAGDRFQQEARAASALSHPNVCHIYALGMAPDGRQFIAMEYVAGDTLRKRLHSGPLALRESLDIATQIAAAVVASHAATIVHRDIKPENVIITADGLVKVLDFGLAKICTPFPLTDGVEDSTRTVAHTDAGTIVGTVAYMSPEQARGQSVDARTDIWSLGAVIYEMVAGRSPFSGVSGSDMVAAILEHDPLPLPRFDPHVPQELVRIVSKALRKNRDERYQTAKDLLLDLRNLKTQIESGTLPAPVDAASAPVVGARPHASRVVWILSASAVLLAAGLTGGYFWWKQRAVAPAAAGPGRFTLKQMTMTSGLTIDPAISRDGRLVAFASDRSGEHLDLWVQQVAGGEPLRLTTDPANDSEPTFSTDGTSIVFRSDRGRGGIYKVSALGGPEELIVPDGRRPRVSPDGRWVAYWVGRTGSGNPFAKGAANAFVIDYNGGTPRQLAPEFATARHPVWSADSKQLLFFGNREEGKPPDWCLVSMANLSDTQCLDAGKLIGEDGALHEHHAASGWAHGYAIYDQAEGDAHDLWRVAVDPAARKLSGTPERLTYGPGVEADAVFGAEGQILFTDIRSATDIWSVALDAQTGRSTGEERPITSDPAHDALVRASGDGSSIIFASNRAGENTDLWVRDLRTGHERRVTSGQRAQWSSLDSSGGRAAYLSLFRDRRELHVVTLSNGQNETICEKGCGSSTPIWSRDGTYLVSTSGREIGRIDLTARKWVPIINRPPSHFWEPDISPDGKWLAFLVRPTEASGNILLARLKGDRPIPETEWITVSDRGTEDKPRWSADGKIVYFTSERDGFRCIWGQHVDLVIGKPIGEAFAAHHSHRARRSLKDVVLSALGVAVTRSAMFFVQTEKTGNIWMMEPIKP
jgi:eukaryotic-like serine/threonine-protein kinase